MQTIQRFFTWFSETFRKQGIIGKIVLGSVTLFVLCCLCSVPIALLSPSSKPESNAPSTAQVQSSPIVPQAENQTATLAPTQTPAPTDTPLPPTATPDPNLIKTGTYLVNTDIRPGIYRGVARGDFLNSCYWARLKDLSGNLDALLANDNSIGQYYVEVLATDYAFETRCDMALLTSLEPSGELPLKISAGTYIVGKDIRPGTYRGQAGTDFADSCYWARLKNVAGGLDAILANDNATGQFYVQVAASDFALATACELERVGD